MSLYEPAAKVSTDIDLDAMLGANGTRTQQKYQCACQLAMLTTRAPASQC